MKLTQIALAVAAIGAAPAFAADITVGVPASNIIYISGASALSNTVNGVITSLCNTAPVKYSDNKDGKQTFAYVCDSAKAGAGFAGGSKYIVVKRDEDGSFAGVGPVVNQGTNADGVATGGLNFMDLKNCDTTAKTCNYIKPDFSNGAAVVPHAGLTDVESKIWQGRGQFAPSTTAFQTRSSFAAQGFGVAVTEVLYKALQNKQKADGKLAGSCATGDFTVGSCQPTITREQYTSIASQTGGYHTDWAPIIGAAGAGQAVNLCRRVDTSGTQASSDTYFLSNPCANANPNFGKLAPATAADSAAGSFHVIENSSTGNVKACLADHNNGVNNPKTANNEAAEGMYAVGVVSLENAPDAGWKFVKLSNTSPNLDAKQRQTAIDGEYDFAFEFEALWRDDLDTTRKTFMDAFVGQLSDPNKVDLRGIYVVPGTFDNPSFPTKVGKATRLGNSCQPFQMFY